MQLFLQILVNGVLLGGLYTLMALRLALVWGVLNIVNGPWSLYHARRLRLLLPFHARAYRSFRGAANWGDRTFRNRLRHSALHSQLRDQSADFQYPLSYLWIGSSVHESGTAGLQR